MDRTPIAILSGITLVLLIAVGWISMPLPPERRYDADLRPLAMSHQEAYCSGVAYWSTAGKGDRGKAKDCVKGDGSELDTERDLRQVIFWFCQGVADTGFEGSQKRECQDVLETSKLWPILEGVLSAAFNDRYPWPGDIFVARLTDDGSDSRTGDRDGFTRGGL